MVDVVTASGGARFRRLIIAASIIVLGGLTVLAVTPAADAHGAPTRPGSRTYLCRIDGTHASGDIQPSNQACAEAVAIGGKQPLWDWFGVLRSDGAGRTRGYIPDGQLCSGGEPKYAGYDLARADWPYTSLTAGEEMIFRYNAWAAHPGEFRLYITRDGYDPTQSLRWDDLEPEPFSVYGQNNPNGRDEANDTADYQWSITLPDKSGPHIIYSVWERSDSQETFYGCSDVRFDGGSGEVVGVGPGANVVGPPPGDTPATTTAPRPDGSASTIPAADANSDGAGDASAGDAMGAGDGQAMGEGDGYGDATAATPDQSGPPATTDGQPIAVPAEPGDGSALASVEASTGDGAGSAASPDQAAATPSLAATPPPDGTGSSGGIGWLAILAVGAAGVALGVASTVAIMTTLRNRELRARLDHYQRLTPFPGHSLPDGPPMPPGSATGPGDRRDLVGSGIGPPGEN
ncbi:MAG: lytic polysaccharide monooxygenase [Actinomycetota bacterium]